MSGLSIEVSEADAQFIEVKWEDEVLFIFYKSLFLRDLKKLNGMSGRGAIMEAIAEIEQKLARREVIRLLARKGYFAVELQDKLTSKGFSKPVIEGVIRYAQEKGYIDDEERIERFIAGEFKKGFGLKGVYFKLKQKNLLLLVTPAIRAWMEEEERRSLSGYIAQKKVKGKEQKKLIAHLLQRGYSYSTIQGGLSNRN